MAYSVSCYSVRGNPALCWQRSGLVLGDVHPEAFSCGNGKFLGLIIRWKSKETIRDLYGISCRTYHSLMVAPHCLDGSYSRHSSKCLCWLRFIFYFRNEFFSTLCTSNNIKYSFKCVSSIFDYHKEKSPPILRLHVCVCGRPYGSLIFKKHCELNLKIFLYFDFKDK